MNHDKKDTERIDHAGHLGMLGTLGTIAGCNTVAGAGKDVQSGGEKLHDEAKETQKKM